MEFFILSHELCQQLDKIPLNALYHYIAKREQKEIESNASIHLDDLHDIEDDTKSESESNTEIENSDDDPEHSLRNAYERILDYIHLMKEPKYMKLLEAQGIPYLDLIFGTLLPFRSITTYTPSTINVDVEKIQSHIDWLRSRPQPEQRTTEWYLYRHTRVTASSAWKILDTQSQYNRYIWEKCKPLNSERFERTSLDTPFHWGHKYEPLASMYYEQCYNTTIEDFGCIPHYTEEWLAASPDGINVDPQSSRFGRMLEIKNIVNRVITGVPKKEYWIQMQLQMEVCQLPECDFLECRFKEYENRKEFETDGTWYKTSNGKSKGIMLMFNHDDEKLPRYEYPPQWRMTREESMKWQEKIIEENKKQGWYWNQTIYWRLEEVSCVLVERNQHWFNGVKEELHECWKTIQYEKENGSEHRKPTQRQKTYITKQKPDFKSQGCILNIETDDL
jgi:putative phage-type endonuclease